MKKICIIFVLLCLSIFTEAQVFTFTFDGVSRNYRLHLPSGYNSDSLYPLVFNLHGYTSNALEQELYSQMNVMADAEGFIVVYPNGISNFWNSGFGGIPYYSGTDDVGFISAIIDSLLLHYSVDEQRIYSCGMSNGGFQSYRLACELSDRIVAIASVTGSITDSTAFYCNPSRQVPVLEIHGTEDPIVPYTGLAGCLSTDDAVEWWQSYNGCAGISDTSPVADVVSTDSCYADFIRFTTCDNGIENWFYKIYHGGHTWPDGLIDLPINGHTNHDFNASQLIWDFFSRYKLEEPSRIEDVKQEAEWMIAPNPATDVVYLESFEAGVTNQIMIFDMQGRQLSVPLSIEDMKARLEVQNLANGNYILRLQNETGLWSQLKLVVLH